MLSLLIIIPFFSILFFNLMAYRLVRRFVFFWAIILFLSQFLFGLALFSPGFLSSAAGGAGHAPGALSSSYFFDFDLSVDGLSAVMLICIAVSLLVTAIIAVCTIEEEKGKFNFLNLLLFILCGLNGLVLARDIFSLYVFIEIVNVTSWILIGFNKDIKALSAAFKYVILSTVASIALVCSVGLIVLLTGSTKFTVISQVIEASAYNQLLALSLALFVCASFIKAGAVPFHGWVAEVYGSSPAAVSVALSGVISKTAGIYTLIRVVKGVFGFNLALNNVLLLTGTVPYLLEH